MSRDIQKILKWYKQYDNMDIVIKTASKEFNININQNSLPHLLGLHYITKEKMPGKALLNMLRGKRDEEIYNSIIKNNSYQYINVVNRVQQFEGFMKNLENAELYNQAHNNSKIKSEYLFVKLDNGQYVHLGIGRDRADTDYFETFIVGANDNYIKNSTFKEKVETIERYENAELIPFSFDENKNNQLMNEYEKAKIEALLKEQNKETIDKDTDNDGVIDRYDADFRDSDVQEIGDLDEKISVKEQIANAKEKLEQNKESIEKGINKTNRQER